MPVTRICPTDLRLVCVITGLLSGYGGLSGKSRIPKQLEDERTEARDQLSPMCDGDSPGRNVARTAAAWLAQSGMVALVVTEEATEPDIQSDHPRAESEAAHHLNQPSPHGQTDEARLVRLSAQKLWAEG